MNDLSDSLQRMTFVQLSLLLGFLTSYVLALGGMLGGAARRRSVGVASACAVGFAAYTDPWVHGALLIVFVVAGLGVFVALAWLVARLFSPRADVLPSQLVPQTSLLVDTQQPPLSLLPQQPVHRAGPTAGTANALR